MSKTSKKSYGHTTIFLKNKNNITLLNLFHIKTDKPFWAHCLIGVDYEKNIAKKTTTKYGEKTEFFSVIQGCVDTAAE